MTLSSLVNTVVSLSASKCPREPVASKAKNVSGLRGRPGFR